MREKPAGQRAAVMGIPAGVSGDWGGRMRRSSGQGALAAAAAARSRPEGAQQPQQRMAFTSTGLAPHGGAPKDCKALGDAGGGPAQFCTGPGATNLLRSSED
eukprot:2934638-Pyramimonas_sp.AAC.1